MTRGRRPAPSKPGELLTFLAMALGVGMVGPPNVGKSTLFNALTRAGVGVASYAFSTIEPNTAIVEVPDARLDVLARMYKPKKVTATVMKFVDVAGLVAGASRGEGMGNQFLSNIRELDALAMVVRCFRDPNVPHVTDRLDPQADMAMVNLELALADLEVVNKRREKIGTSARLKPGAKEQEELQMLDRIGAHLDQGKPIRTMAFEAEEAKLLKSYAFLTAKPVVYVANVAEDQIGKDTPELRAVIEEAEAEHAGWIALSAKLEADVRELSDEEAAAFLQDAGLSEPALNAFIAAAYKLLNLLTFLTAGEPEVRAWTVRQGAKAPEAAGVIHSDFERGFIKAEIVSYEDLVAAGTYAAARERGKVRLEGRDYLMKDGDVCLFRFNV
jgi:GTP-binding protein YchF